MTRYRFYLPVARTWQHLEGVLTQALEEQGHLGWTALYAQGCWRGTVEEIRVVEILATKFSPDALLARLQRVYYVGEAQQQAFFYTTEEGTNDHLVPASGASS